MQILLTNDDGLFAPGIIALARELSGIAEVIIVAPESPRSAVGHSITLHKALRLNRVTIPGLDVEAYTTNGTPTDAVMLGFFAVLSEEKPDLVISGINKGPNMGEDITYSGTVAAAMEGALVGIPSISMSLGTYDGERFDQAAKFLCGFVAEHRSLIPEPPRFLNINYPDLDLAEIKGLMLTRLGTRKYKDVVHEKTDPRGVAYYWIAGEKIFADDVEGTDIYAVHNGYVSVCPLTMDLTDYNLLEALRRKVENGAEHGR
ncbi:MAG: 5'/3'-nucleotidase SurE [Candidatus Dadabacteria bacterium]|nr:5'/3'-nucleotidase SurE [Candidatus Dadabacteria bacterium]